METERVSGVVGQLLEALPNHRLRLVSIVSVCVCVCVCVCHVPTLLPQISCWSLAAPSCHTAQGRLAYMNSHTHTHFTLTLVLIASDIL